MLSILGSWILQLSNCLWLKVQHNGGPPLMRPLLRPHICLRRPQPPPKTGPPHASPHQYGLLSSHDKSQASFCFIWRDVICWCDKNCHIVWQIVSQFDNFLASKWSKGPAWCTSAVQPKNLENTGIFVFSRVCPCVCRKQTNKHGQSSLSVNQRFQDFSFNFKIKFAEK